MTWEVKLAVRGKLAPYFAAEAETGAQAVTSGIKRRTLGLQKTIRNQIKRGGLARDGDRFPNTVRSLVKPSRGSSFNTFGVVFSKAIYRRKSGALVDLLTVFDEGTVVRPRAGGKALAVPLSGQRSRRDGRSRATPGDFAKLKFIPLKGGNLVGLFIDPATKRPAFLLLRLVRIRKRLQLDTAYNKAIAGLEGLITADWERRMVKAARRLGVAA